jgi:hypothetical protein
MAPTAHERYSRETAALIVYANGRLGFNSAAWIVKAAQDPYGAPLLHDDFTRTLCTLCREMTPEQQAEVIYDGRNPEARKLADWWDKHKASDAAREAEEQRVNAMVTTVKTVLAGL